MHCGVMTCPICKKDVKTYPWVGEWMGYVTCVTLDCPYGMEYRGPGRLTATASYTKLYPKKG